MSKITPSLMGIGAYEIEFRGLPDLLDQFVPGRTLVFYRGAERYWAGVILEPLRDAEVITAKGPGLEFWLGEDDKNGSIRIPRTYTSLRTDQIIDNLLYRESGVRALNPGTLNLGNVLANFSIAYESARYSIRRLAAMTRTEYRVNPDGTFDWAGNLAAPGLFAIRDVVLAAAAGTVENQIEYQTSAFRVAGKVWALGRGEGPAIIVATATTALPGAWKDYNNNPYERGLVIDAPDADTFAEAQFVADAQAGLHSTERKSASCKLARADLLGEFYVGDTVHVYQPLLIEDPEAARLYNGETYPALAMRVTQIEIDLGPEWEVKLRLPDGSEEDLTPFVVLGEQTEASVELAGDPDKFFDLGDIDATITDTRRNNQPGPADPPDTTTPAAPAGLTLTKSVYKDYAGQQLTKLSFTWTAVTQNTDATAITDLQGYVVRYRRVTGNPADAYSTLEVPAPDVKVSVEDLPVGLTWEAAVEALDNSGNESAWSATVNTSSTADTTPPPQPSAPTAVAGIKQVHLHWERTDAASNAMPADVRWYEVHASETTGFTPTNATKRAEEPGTLASVDMAVGTWYFKLIAVDYAGNKSVGSPQSAAATIVLISSVDVQPQGISGANIADGAVGTLKLADGAVLQDKIAAGVISTDKLVVGNWSNLAEDPSFEKSATGFLGAFATSGKYWHHNGTPGETWEIVTDVGNARTGAKVAKRVSVSGTILYAFLTNNNRVSCRAGDEFYGECFFKTSGGANGDLTLKIQWRDSNFAVISAPDIVTNATRPTAYTLLQGAGVAPAGAAYAEILLSVNNHTGGTYWIDDAFFHKTVISAYISDLAVISAKIADLAVGTGKIDNLAVVSGKIALLAVGTAQIADLAVNSAKIADLVADKITTGVLQATFTLSGTIKTATSGRRIEMDSYGFRLYDAAGTRVVYLSTADEGATGIPPVEILLRATGDRLVLTGEGIDLYASANSEGNGRKFVDWWRDGQGDSNQFMRVGGWFTSSEIVSTYELAAKGALTSKMRFRNYDAAGAINQSIELNQTADFIDIDGDYHGGTKGRMLVYKGRAGGGEHIGIYADVRLSGAGLMYENGFTAFASAVAAVNKSTIAITYGTAWPSAGGTPDVIGTCSQDSGTSLVTCNVAATSRTGCSVNLVNLHTTTAFNVGAAFIPIVT